MKWNFSKTKLQGFFAIILLIVFSLGCNIVKQLASKKDSTNSNIDIYSTPTTGSTTKVENLFASAEPMQSFVSQLKEKVGSENPNLLKLVIYDSYAMVQVQDPKKPENIDGYTYRAGKLSEPAPVKIIGGGKIEDNVFPLKDVNLDAIPALNTEVLDKLKDVEGGKIIGFSINRQLPFSKNIEIYILTNATRKSVTAQADAKGKLTKFEVK